MTAPNSIPPGESRPTLAGRRILVVDGDDAMRRAARDMLVRYFCLIEQARDGAEACAIIRNLEAGARFDVIIADIQLSDISGPELFLKLKETMDVVPMIISCGFGYDVALKLIKARRAGLVAVIYKPFRRDQLLGTVDRIIAGDILHSEILR